MAFWSALPDRDPGVWLALLFGRGQASKDAEIMVLVMRSRCSGVRSPGRSRTGPTARLITSEPGCDSVTVAAEDLFVIETPGGGG